MDVTRKPAELFDRDAEWADLVAFATDPAPGARLGLVYGRRRQGKTLILELLCEALGGFMVTGVEQSDAQNLADLSAAFTRFTAASYPVTFTDWAQAVDALFRLGEEREAPLPVVLDEFGYLVARNPAIPSLIQNALSPRGRARRQSRTRLILCGSALTLMRGLLAASAPLRGRATTELMLHPFDFRDAAGLWGLAGMPDVALRVNALVGGTPAYRDFCAGDAPRDAHDVDAWVLRRLLNPASAMFREGRVLLAEEPAITNPAPYYAVLAAIAADGPAGVRSRTSSAGTRGVSTTPSMCSPTRTSSAHTRTRSPNARQASPWPSRSSGSTSWSSARRRPGCRCVAGTRCGGNWPTPSRRRFMVRTSRTSAASG